MKLFVYEDLSKVGGVEYWRCLQPLSQIMDVQVTFPEKKRLNEIDILSHDAFLFYRVASKQTIEIMKTCKSMGKFVVMDVDDLVTDIPAWHPARGTYSNAMPLLFEAIEICDLIWASTPEIKNMIAHKNCFIVPNAINEKDISVKQNYAKNRVLFRGGSYTWTDILPNMQFYEDHKDKIAFNFMGYLPANVPSGCFLPWIGGAGNYIRSIMAMRPSYIWKPMAENLFNDAKSNIAMLESLLCGALCITNYTTDRWKGAVNALCESEQEYNLRFSEAEDIAINEYNLFTHNLTRSKSLLSLL